MSEFDDPQMEQLLGGAGGAYPDVNTAYAQMQGRGRQIKRRRAMIGGTAACVLLAAGGVFALGSVDDRGTLQPGDRGDGGSATIDSARRSSTTDDVATETSVPTIDSTATGSGSGNHGSVVPGPGSVPTTRATVATPPDSGEQTYSSLGCSITVKVSGGALVLVSTHAADGFALDSSTVEPGRVEFRWRNGNLDARIRIDLINGVPVRQV